MMKYMLLSAEEAGSVPSVSEGLDPASAMTQSIAYSTLLVVIIICAVLSVFFSFRYRRSLDARLRGLNQARMNICMGILLIAIALIQIFMFEANWLRSIIGAVFLVIGLFNLFAGIRNRRIFMTAGSKSEERK